MATKKDMGQRVHGIIDSMEIICLYKIAKKSYIYSANAVTEMYGIYGRMKFITNDLLLR